MQPGKSQQLPLTAKGSRGGALPVEVGARFEHDLKRAIGALPGVTLWRNPKIKAFAMDGRPVLTGIAGKGAPDFLVEVRGADGQYRCVWLESKGNTSELNPDQKIWHAAAAQQGRHVRIVHDAAEALDVVREFQAAGRLEALERQLAEVTREKEQLLDVLAASTREATDLRRQLAGVVS